MSSHRAAAGQHAVTKPAQPLRAAQRHGAAMHERHLPMAEIQQQLGHAHAGFPIRPADMIDRRHWRSVAGAHHRQRHAGEGSGEVRWARHRQDQPRDRRIQPAEVRQELRLPRQDRQPVALGLHLGPMHHVLPQLAADAVDILANEQDLRGPPCQHPDPPDSPSRARRAAPGCASPHQPQACRTAHATPRTSTARPARPRPGW